MNISHLNFRSLRSFILLARVGNFARAAETLSISQSALSQQMKELDSNFSSNLFERSGRKSLLSDFGRDLVEKLEPLISQIDEAILQSMGSTRNVTGTLRIGATNTYSKAITLPASIRMLKIYPDLKIDMRELSANKLIIDLLEGNIDIAVLPQDYELIDFHQQPLVKERFSVLGSSEFLEKFPKKITLKSLASYDMALLSRQFLMRQQIDMQARKENIHLNVRLDLSTMDDLLAVAKRGELLVIGSPIACIAEPEIKFRSIGGDFLKRTAALCWRKDRFVTGAMHSFRDMALDISEKLK